MTEIWRDRGPNSKHGGAEGGRKESNAHTEFVGERDPEEASHAVGDERTVDGICQLLKRDLVIRGKIEEPGALMSDDIRQVTYHNDEIGGSQPCPVGEDRENNVLLEPWKIERIVRII